MLRRNLFRLPDLRGDKGEEEGNAKKFSLVDPPSLPLQ